MNIEPEITLPETVTQSSLPHTAGIFFLCLLFFAGAVFSFEYFKSDSELVKVMEKK